jgi:DNA gyrase/topoisomerase IV subunit A
LAGCEAVGNGGGKLAKWPPFAVSQCLPFVPLTPVRDSLKSLRLKQEGGLGDGSGTFIDDAASPSIDEDSGDLSDGALGLEAAGAAAAGASLPPPWVLFLTKKGLGKRVPVSLFKAQGRGGKGVRCIGLHKGDELQSLLIVGKGGATSFSPSISSGGGDASAHQPLSSVTSPLVGGGGGSGEGAADVESVAAKEDLLVSSMKGVLCRVRVADVPVGSRARKGVKVVRMDADDQVQSAAVVTGPAAAAVLPGEEDGEEA